MSLRWRIALGLALIAALVCAFGAVGAYVTTSRQLETSLDDSLLAGGRTAAMRTAGPGASGRAASSSAPAVPRPASSSRPTRLS